MPSRFVALAIVGFWLAAAGWFFSCEVWPSLRPDRPPPYSIDLAREATERPVKWDVIHKSSRVGEATTLVRAEEDGFLLESRYDMDLQPIPKLHAKTDVLNRFRVNRTGELRAIEAEVRVHRSEHERDRNPIDLLDLSGRLAGPVADGVFQPAGQVQFFGEPYEVTFDPLPLDRGRFLTPLHPVGRLIDLQPGKSWRIPLFDPLAVMGSARLKDGKGGAGILVATLSELVRGQGGQSRTLEARVRDWPEPHRWGNRDESCLVIEYRGDDFLGRTWVREKDGLVLYQQAQLRGDEISMERVPQP
jgi:hypothetical protein